MNLRGSARRPGADLSRLPVAPDYRAINTIEGLRAGLAAALPMLASVALHAPVLVFAALGALLTCLADPGAGQIRQRAPLLASFGLAGAVLYGGMGVLRGAGVPATLTVAVLLLFGLGFLRVWGTALQGVSNLLAVMLLLGADVALTPGQALGGAALFAAGAAWALLLALLFWQLHPFGPARQAVAEVWTELADMASGISLLLTTEADCAWEPASRQARAAIRAALERARSDVLGALRAHGTGSGASVAAQALARLNTAEQLFPALIALADLLQYADAATRADGRALLRRLRPLLLTLARASLTDQVHRLPRLDRSIDMAMQAAARAPALRKPAQVIAEQLRTATRLVDPAPLLKGMEAAPAGGPGVLTRLAAPALANLSWQSPGLRHALRVAVAVGMTMAATMVWHGRYTHWITLTMVLVLQPSFALTWQRALERMAGTIAGGLVAAGMSLVIGTPLRMALALPPVSAVALSLRQVSYAFYVAMYTPAVVLLVDSIEPGQDSVHVAAARAGFTLVGGFLAVAANLALWPIWEPERLEVELQRALAATAALARTVLAGDDPAAAGKARRAAGLACNTLEASIGRALQEKFARRLPGLDRSVAASAVLRRLGASLTAAEYAPERGAGALWVATALEAMTAGMAVAARPEARSGEIVERLVRQTELLAQTMK